jgi:HEAT repeats
MAGDNPVFEGKPLSAWVALLKDKGAHIRWNAVKTIGRQESLACKAVPDLTEAATNDPDGLVRRSALEALRNVDYEAFLALESALAAKKPIETESSDPFPTSVTSAPPSRHPPSEEQIAPGSSRAADLLSWRMHEDEVKRVLKEQGFDEAISHHLFSEGVQNSEGARKQKQERSGLQMLIGGGMFLSASCISVLLWAAASGPRGGTYLIATGPIILGAVLFFSGLIGKFRK